MNTRHHLHTPLLRSLLCTAALIAGLGASTLLSGCDSRVGEDERVTPAQPRPGSGTDQPSR